MTAEELDERIRRTDPAHLPAFAATCATRMAPVFGGFTRSTSPATYDAWLEELWSLVRSPAPERAQELVDALESVPEAHVDDSHRPDFYAMRALSVLAYAAQTMTDDDPTQAALWCSDENLSLVSAFDFVLKRESDSLASAEAEAQNETLDRLTRNNGAEASVTLDSSRTSPLVARLGGTVDEVVRARDWDMSARPAW
jgi:hypothetical protein